MKYKICCIWNQYSKYNEYTLFSRSAHGFADTDMQTIMNQLLREEEDLVAHRGLLPASDHQTFQMYIPSQLRSYYHRVMPPSPTVQITLMQLKSYSPINKLYRIGLFLHKKSAWIIEVRFTKMSRMGETARQKLYSGSWV